MDATVYYLLTEATAAHKTIGVLVCKPNNQSIMTKLKKAMEDYLDATIQIPNVNFMEGQGGFVVTVTVHYEDGYQPDHKLKVKATQIYGY